MATTTARPKRTPPTLSTEGLKTLLKEGKQGETLERKFTVTPSMAKMILEKHNDQNRNINTTHLMSLVRDIRNGNWIEGTGTMISFSQNGQLIDGQHRLGAIAKAKTPLNLSFKFGLSDEAQRVIDTGRKRTYSDFIAMREGLDAKYKAERASVTRLLYGFLYDQERPHVYTNNNKPTQSDLYKVSEEFGEEIMEAVSKILSSGHMHRVVIGSYAVFVYLLATHTTHADKADEFFELLATGANMSTDNPIMVTRNRLMTREDFRVQKNKDRTLGLLVKTWNMWVRGETTSPKMHNPEHMPPMEGLTKLGKRKLYR